VAHLEVTEWAKLKDFGRANSSVIGFIGVVGLADEVLGSERARGLAAARLVEVYETGLWFCSGHLKVGDE